MGAIAFKELRQATAPLLRVLRAVKYGVNRHSYVGKLIEDNIGKTPHNCPAVGRMSNLIHFWIAPDELNASMHRHNAETLHPNPILALRTRHTPEQHPALPPAG